MNDTRQMLCERCRKFVAVNTIKYVPKGDGSRMALCAKCLSTFKVEQEKKKQAASSELSESGKQSYFCARCRYKFKYKPSSRNELRCPYCGKADKILDNKETDAATLVKNADEF